MIYLEKVNENNFRTVINLKVAEDQSRFVATNLYSLAQAWVFSDVARPYAIKNYNQVGFLIFDWDENERSVGIWRFMIDEKYQGQGFGKKALEEAIKIIKEANKFDIIHLEFVPANTKARNLYYSLGFRENGKMDGDEIVMVLPITDNPKVGFTIADKEDIDELYELFEKNKSLKVINNKEDLLKKIEECKAKRYTIFGKTIACSFDNNLIIDTSYLEYKDEIDKIMINDQ